MSLARSTMSWDLFATAALAGVVAHQLFHRYEAAKVPVQLSLLFLPPPILSTIFLFGRLSHGLSIVTALLITYPTFLTSLVLSTVIYRLSPFHPLAKYPGPLLCKVSKFWMAFKCLPGYQQHYLKSLHDRYGDIVRTGPNELTIRDPSVVPAILGASGAPKGPHWAGRLLQNENLPMLAIEDTEVHIQRRRAWGRGLSLAAIKGYEELITNRVQQLVSQLELQSDEADLCQWINWFTYDVMSDMVFGGGSELLSGKDEHNFWSILDDALGPSTFLGHVPWLGFYLSYLPGAVEPVNIILAKCRELAETRLKQGSLRQDLFYYLNNEDIPDKLEPPPMSQLAEDGVLAIIGGADTVASALASLFSCLLEHPEIFAKLQAEVDAFYPPGENPLDTKHHRDMPYLNAVINETLRLFPPGASCTQRRVPDGGSGMMAGSEYFPPGTNLWIHIFSMQRDPRNFSPHPEGFYPERWLPSAEKDPARVHNPGAFFPFSHGPMNCVGKTLAWQEMRTVVVALVQRFGMRAAPGWHIGEYEVEYKDYFMASRGPVRAKLEVRA